MLTMEKILFLRSIPDVSTPAAREAAKRALIEGSALRLALEAVTLLEGARTAAGLARRPASVANSLTSRLKPTAGRLRPNTAPTSS